METNKIHKVLKNIPARFSVANLRQTAFSSEALHRSAKDRISATDFTDIYLHIWDSHINLSLSRPYLSAAANNFAVSDSDAEDTDDELNVSSIISSVRQSL